MLGNLFKKKEVKTSEQIKLDREKWLQEMLDKSLSLDRLIKANGSGWGEFMLLIEDYIDKAKKRKAITALDRSTEEDIYQLKLLDHEIYLLSWVLKIPEQFIGNVRAEIERNNQGGK
jgi:hypothetical protein